MFVSHCSAQVFPTACRRSLLESDIESCNFWRFLTAATTPTTAAHDSTTPTPTHDTPRTLRSLEVVVRWSNPLNSPVLVTADGIDVLLYSPPAAGPNSSGAARSDADREAER
jgi:hypothetical protein